MEQRLTSPPRQGRTDLWLLLGLALGIAIMAVFTWRKWGNPEGDAGAELTTADLVADGALPYRDIRYYYGPVGLYSLALGFKLFGTSFTTAFAFGFLQLLAIVGVYYALARVWLRPVFAAAATAVVIAIGFSGTPFNFVLPHTNSATFGTLFILLQLLALAHRRLVLAGAATSVLLLTRPEFAACGAIALAAYLVGHWRDAGGRAALRALPALLIPALVPATLVLGWFAYKAGAARLFTENLWPVDFIRSAGFRSQENWAPFTVDSFATTAGRVVVYAALVAGLVGAALGWTHARGARRVLALWPMAAAVVGLAALDAALRLTGVLGGARATVEQESQNLLIGMSWLPALGLGVLVWIVLRFARGRSAPLSGRWSTDLALVAVAAALGFRAYDAFTAEGSYAPYYAAPLVLVAGILHQRIADRWRPARMVSAAALGAVALALTAYALVGLYSDAGTTVRTARGSYVAHSPAAPAIQRTVDLLTDRTRPDEPILAMPADGGIYFMVDRPPALYELTVLPGLLDSRDDERRAASRLERLGVRYVVVGAQDFSPYGFRQIGRDYGRVLMSHVRDRYRRIETIGDFDNLAVGSYPSSAFEVYAQRPGRPVSAGRSPGSADAVVAKSVP